MPDPFDLAGRHALVTGATRGIGLAMASAMLSAYFGFCCEALAYQEVTFDVLDARMLPQLPFSSPSLS